VIVASAAITALSALNLHGGTAYAFRLLTLVLSALVTVCTGLLELLQVNHRWRLYRQLRSKLTTLGWQTALHASEPPAAPLAAIGTGLISAMGNFEAHYMSEVAADSDGESDGSKAKAGHKPDATGGDHAQPADHNPADQNTGDQP
jgi:hypothetical protein